MKREYQKPYLAMESFQLNAAIAASCSSEGKTPINYGVDSCGNGYFGVYFGSSCEVDVTNPGGDENDELCYQGLFDPNLVFIQS